MRGRAFLKPLKPALCHGQVVTIKDQKIGPSVEFSNAYGQEWQELQEHGGIKQTKSGLDGQHISSDSILSQHVT